MENWRAKEVVYMSSLQESSEWIAIKFGSTKFRDIYLYLRVKSFQ